VDQADIIREQLKHITASGVLGRSRSYARLLEYLVTCSLRDHAPKELEIATEVFGKDAGFDPSQDSMVRVYAHNLRQKIKQFYESAGADQAWRLEIPKGEYRVMAKSASAFATTAQPMAAAARRPALGLVAAFCLVFGLIVGWSLREDGGGDSIYQSVADSPVWRGLLDDDLPTLVVVGDYYIFGELDEVGNVARLVREFDVNSSADLDDVVMFEPQLTDRYIDLDLTYLPRSAAFALKDSLRVLFTSDKSVRVISMSELNVADLKANHVVYVGYISALDKLLPFVFRSSSLAVGDTFDELFDKQTGSVYRSEAGLPADRQNYRDYGLVSTFPGPSGNHFVIIAGTRDAGLMHSAQALADPMYVGAVERALANGGELPQAFELLYEVTGFDRTNLDAMLVHAAALDHAEIWGGELLSAE